MFCKQCGAQIPENSAFCITCGAEASENVAPVVVPVGAEMDATVATAPVPPVQQTQQFQPVAEAPVQQTQQTQQFQSVVEPQQYQAAPEPYVAPVPTTAEKVTSGSSDKKNVVVLIVVIGVVLLSLIGVVVALFATGVIDLSNIDTGSSKGGKGDGEEIVSDEYVETRDLENLSLSQSNLYYDDYVDSSSYILSASNSRYYSRAELSGMTRQQIYLAEREIFARYGCTFNDGDLDEYFNAKAWYTGNYGQVGNFNLSNLTPIERVNLLMLRALLMERDGTTSNNEYMKANNDVDGWIISGTDTSRITKADVENKTETELTIAANEIFARNGYIFDDDNLQTYFSSKNWYVPSTPSGSFNKANMTDIEQDNYDCLLECAKKKAGVRFTAGNRYQSYYYSYSEYQCPGSDKYPIDPWTLQYMSAEELKLARNEIYARYGYSYTDNGLREYFMNCSWYYPTVANGKLDLISLNKTETANVKLIQAFELNQQLREGTANPNTKMSYYAKHDYLTMYLPDHWRNNCICIKPTGLSGNLDFYEKYNQEEGSGWLFSMDLVPVEQGIPYYPGCRSEVFGTVTTPEGAQYYVIKVMPNYDEYYFLESVYDLMQSQIDTIWSSIEWKSGYTFQRY